MFKKAILVLTAAATLTGAAATLSAPAEAHPWPHYWGHYHTWGHPQFFASTVIVPGGECYWVSRPAKVWTPGGWVWGHRNIRVCD